MCAKNRPGPDHPRPKDPLIRPSQSEKSRDQTSQTKTDPDQTQARSTVFMSLSSQVHFKNLPEWKSQKMVTFRPWYICPPFAKVYGMFSTGFERTISPI